MKTWVVLLMATLCGALSRPAYSAGTKASVSAVPAQPNTSFSCDGFPGSDAVVALAGERRFIVMGEKHGTEQAPRLFGTLVCGVSRHRPVNVFLEFRAGSTAAVQAYVSSDGSGQARQTFLADSIWDRRTADGRNIRAMFELVETLRRLKQAGAPIQVFSTQPDYPTLRPQYYSELARANEWARLAVTHPEGVNLVLVGTAHAALNDNDDLGFDPAAAHLRPADVLSIGPVKEGGDQWALNLSDTGQPIVGVFPLPGRPSVRGIRLVQGNASGWNATYAFGEPAQPSRPQRD